MRPARLTLVKTLRSRSKCLGAFGDILNQAANEIEALAEDRERARHLASHLFDMIPEEEWRNEGAIGPEGQSEGLYWAAGIAEEIRGWERDKYGMPGA